MMKIQEEEKNLNTNEDQDDDFSAKIRKGNRIQKKGIFSFPKATKERKFLYI